MTETKEFLISELGGKHLPFPWAPARTEIHLVNYCYVYCVAGAIAFNLFVSHGEETQVCFIIIVVLSSLGWFIHPVHLCP